MLSYLHPFHAGNHADILKHSVLALTIKQLQKKDKPLCIYDTHGGRGMYDLTDNQAKKTREYQTGIGKLWGTEHGMKNLPTAYTKSIENCQRAPNQNHCTDYPGSPFVAADMLRKGDQVVAMELHPKEHRILADTFKHNKQVAIHNRDGFEGLIALSPPSNRRGIVLMDPSYETKADYQNVAATVERLNKHWPEAVILVWYPILVDAVDKHRGLLNRIKKTQPNGLLNIQLMVKADDAKARRGMIGSGVLVINQPWGFAAQLPPLIKHLHSQLADEGVDPKQSSIYQVIRPA